VRSDVVESRHRGQLAVLDVDGRPLLELGDPRRPIFPRSTNKPLQAVVMVELGLDLDADLLAVACASHVGLPRHVDAVARILAAAGLTAEALANVEALPEDPDAMRMLLAQGGRPDRVHQNCSGNHAAMLATCAVAGWPTSGYLDPTHPLQVAIRAGYQTMSGTPMGQAAIDGCGAPLYEMSLVELARSYQSLLGPQATAAGARVAAAMSRYPELTEGPGRPTTGLMAAVPWLVAKRGAEGVYAVALPDGRAIALKIEDGAARACVPVVVAVLRWLGATSPDLERWATVPVLGQGRPVGVVRAVAGLLPGDPGSTAG
jgi:L-asparaginase II